MWFSYYFKLLPGKKSTAIVIRDDGFKVNDPEKGKERERERERRVTHRRGKSIFFLLNERDKFLW